MQLNYELHWGLFQNPFEETTDPSFFYEGIEYTEALSRMKYCYIDDNIQYFLLTGNVGIGKTFLCQRFCQKEHNGLEPLFLPNGNISYEDLLQEMLSHFHSVKLQNSFKLTEYNKQKLFFELTKKQIGNRKMVIIIDESQQMSLEDFLKLRLLSNEQAISKNLKIFLVGQPELRNRILDVPQLEQRIGMHFHLPNLTQDDVKNYILFRLLKAGSVHDIFSEECYSLLFRRTQGLPRLINRYCRLALHHGAHLSAKKVDIKYLTKIIDDFAFAHEVA